MAGSGKSAAGQRSRQEPVGYRPPQVCKIVGITYRQLDYWARTELLVPSITGEAGGSGSRRLYSYQDLLRLKVIKQLLDAGVSLREARHALECLKESFGQDLASANLVMARQGSVLAESEEQVFDLLRGGQGVLNVLPLAGVVEQVDAAVHDLGSTKSTKRGPENLAV